MWASVARMWGNHWRNRVPNYVNSCTNTATSLYFLIEVAKKSPHSPTAIFEYEDQQYKKQPFKRSFSYTYFIKK